jgi:hypothetical protein
MFFGGTPNSYLTRRCQAGDRHLKFHETRDNLTCSPGAGRPPATSKVAAAHRMLDVVFYVDGHARLLITPTPASDAA